MAQTNVQAFSGDVQITSNLAVDTDTLFVDSVGNRVGIGTVSPVSTLTVNEIPFHRATYDHSLAPVTITNRIPTSTTTLNDPKELLNLAREGTDSQAFGARATFKLSRYENSGVASRTRLDLNLAHGQYDDVHVMTVRSDGNVGIGKTDPGVALDVVGNVAITGPRVREGNEIRYTSTWADSNNNQEFGIPFTSVSSWRVVQFEIIVAQVADNVSALSTGIVRGYFLHISSATSTTGYATFTDGVLMERFEVAILNTGSANTLSIKYRPVVGFLQGVNGVIGIRIITNGSPESFGTLTRTDLGVNAALAAPTLSTFSHTIGGNVGIGITNPVAQLDVAGSSTNGRSLQLRSGDQSTETDSAQIIFSYQNSPFNSGGFAHSIRTRHNNGADNGNAIDFWLWDISNTLDSSTLGDKHVMTIEGNGRVGIGTTSPGATLEVVVPSNAPAIISGPGNPGIQFDNKEGGPGNTKSAFITYKHGNRGDEDEALQFLNESSSGTNRAFTFLTSGVTNRMTILDNGNVGIGNASPASRLDFGTPVVNRIINLFGGGGDQDSTDYYGFGINNNTLRYNAQGTVTVHKFFGGATEYGFVDNATGFVNSFTGQHKSFPHESLSSKSVDELSGLIVCASGEHLSVNDSIPQRGKDGITISEAIPIVCLSSYMNEKTVFGVVSDVEDPENTRREDRYGAFTSTFKKIVGDTRIYVNSLGEGAVWVCNTNGSLVNGDYITTSNIAGYGQKQDSDTLKNYTVAKITMDCDFRGTLVPKKQIKKKTVTETLQETVEEEYEYNMPENVYTYDVDRECYVKTVKDNIKTSTRPVMQDYELRDSDGNVITETVSKTISTKEYEILVNKEGCVANISGYQNEDGTITVEEYSTLEDKTGYSEIIDNYTQPINQPVTYSGKKIIVKTVTHEIDDLDEYGNLQWEDHPTETETAYKIRYLDADGTITDEANAVHTAAFVGCTYHCG